MLSIPLELLSSLSSLSDIHGYHYLLFLGPVSAFLIVVVIFYQISTQRYRYPVNCVKYLHRDPIFGLDVLLQSWQDMNANRYSERSHLQHQKYGPTFVTCVLGQTTINTIDPENIVTVTTTHFDDYIKSDWTKLVRKYMGRGILMNDDAEWKSSRDMLRPAFMRNRADDLVMIERHTKNLIDRIATRYAAAYFDFKNEVSLLIMDITTEMLFGRSVGTLSGDQPDDNPHDDDGRRTEERFFHLVDQLEPIATMFIELGPLAVLRFLFQRRRILAIVNGIQAFFHRAVVEAFQQKKSKSKSNSMRDESYEHEHRGGILHMIIDAGNTPDDVQGELQNLFFAAYDTTTALATNIFDILGRRPDVTEKLRRQVNDQLSGRHPTGTDLAQMEYLRYVVFETIRLFSPVTSHTRKARRDTILPRGGGQDGKSPLLVPRGSCIAWSTYALNRLEDIYGPDSLEFRPERWSQLTSLHGKSFFPFGSGPRNCLGQQFAMLEISYIVVRLLQEFREIELRDPSLPFQEAKAVTFYNGRGTVLKML